MPDQATPTRYHRQVVRLFEALTSRGLSSFIENVEFDDCDVYGPAVVILVRELSFDHCIFDVPLDVLAIPAEEGRPYVGVIGLANVTFKNCRIHNIGLLAPRAALEAFRKDLGLGDD